LTETQGSISLPLLRLKELTVNKTYATKPSDIKRDWYIVDAEGQTLGRLATRIAAVLKGKHKPIYTPSMDTGDYVIVVNAEKVIATGRKMDEKMYYRHTGYPGGLRTVTLREQLAKHPDRVLLAAVRGMLPHNRLGRAMFKKLKVYAGADHPHAAHKPKNLEL
jgi:large subunit ribosomal protein L13